MKQIHFLIILMMVISVYACKTTRPAAKTELDLKERNSDYLLKKMLDGQVNADWFSAKMKLKYESEDMSIGLSGNIRLQRDSLVWLNVKKFGFEIARALVTPDSVFVIDRFNNEYTAEGFDYIQKMLNFPATFSMLQNIILGNPVFFTRQLVADLDGVSYHLRSKSGQPTGDYTVDGVAFLLREMKFTEAGKDRQFAMILDGYETVKKRKNFSYIRQLNMNSRETGRVNVEILYADVELDVPKNIPFKVPSSYRRSR